MSKRLFLWVLLVALSAKVCAQWMAPDSSIYRVMIGGEAVSIPLSDPCCGSSVNSTAHYYILDGPFVEHDTTFLYREYAFYRESDTGLFRRDVSSYFIRSRNCKDHLAHVLSYVYYDKEDEYYQSVFRESDSLLHCWFPHLERQRLEGVPRVWCPVERYRGQYYIAVDNVYRMELNDSMVVHFGMELGFGSLHHLQKTAEGGYRFYTMPAFQVSLGDSTLYTVTLRPSKRAKGVYVMTTSTAGGVVSRQLMTPQQDWPLFDFIDWQSTDHIPDGLQYDEVPIDEHIR